MLQLLATSVPWLIPVFQCYVQEWGWVVLLLPSVCQVHSQGITLNNYTLVGMEFALINWYSGWLLLLWFRVDTLLWLHSMYTLAKL
jgi:hypothetical protein